MRDTLFSGIISEDKHYVVYIDRDVDVKLLHFVGFST